MLQNQLRFTSTLLYDLKRRYGIPVSLYEIKYTTNRRTGEKSISILNSVCIRRAIVAPSKELRNFMYGGGVLPTGGFFDPSDRMVIIDKKDTPGWDYEIDQFIVFDNTRFDLKLLQEYENSSVLKARSIEGQTVLQIAKANSTLILVQTAIGVL
jgi:hypothetical protein